MSKVLEYTYSKIGEKYFPIIPLKVIYRGKEIKLEALLDAGATMCIFNFEILELLEIKREECKRIPLKGIGGYITAYTHKVELLIGNEIVETHVAFSKELAPKINVIGREGVFDNFIVCYNDKDKKVSLTSV